MRITIRSKRPTNRTTGALLGTIAAFTFGLIAMTGHADAGGDEPNPPAPIAVEVLSRHAAFPDDVSVQVKRKLPGQGADVLNLKDAGNVVTARLVLQPGAAFPWHTHPGPVIVSVVEGDLVYQQASDCIERTYGPQDAFVDPGPKLHTAWNPGVQETVLVATFFGVPVNPDGTGGVVTLPDPDQSDRCA
ncbi:cupin domain-containing protein [Ilumatobacter sp.]|uniref:cupin domain-containing protein n=1 Tax=Ilumatobacter sp. TaxID=1967498 RepID=UPI003C4ECDAA